MKDYHKQTMQYISMVVGTILLVVVCITFNYFISSQHKEAEQRNFERQVEEVKRFLNEQNK